MPENRDEKLAKAKNDALKLLSFRARSGAELSKRLRDKGYDESVAAEVLAIFKRQRLVDDGVFAEEFARSRASSGAAGRRRVERDLKAKGVAPSVISKALEILGPEEEESRALEIAQRRLAAWQDVPRQKQRQRLFGFLARRGFSSDTVTAVFQKVFSTHLDLD